MIEELELTLEQKEKLANTIKGMEQSGVPEEVIKQSVGTIKDDFKQKNYQASVSKKIFNGNVVLPEVTVKGGDATLTKQDLTKPKEVVTKEGNKYLKGINLELEENLGVFTQSVDLNDPVNDTKGEIRVGPNINPDKTTTFGINSYDYLQNKINERFDQLEAEGDFDRNLYNQSHDYIYKTADITKIAHPTENRFLTVDELETPDLIEHRNDMYDDLMRQWYESDSGQSALKDVVNFVNKEVEKEIKIVQKALDNNEISYEDANLKIFTVTSEAVQKATLNNPLYKKAEQTNQRVIRGNYDFNIANKMDNDFAGGFYPSWLPESDILKGIYQQTNLYAPQTSNKNNLIANSKGYNKIRQNLAIIDDYELGGDLLMEGNSYTTTKFDNQILNEKKLGKIYHSGVGKFKGEKDEKGVFQADEDWLIRPGYYDKDELKLKLLTLEKKYKEEVNNNLVEDTKFQEQIAGLGNVSFLNEKWEFVGDLDTWQKELGKQMFNTFAGIFTGSLYTLGIENADAFSYMLDKEARKKVPSFDQLSPEEQNKVRLDILDGPTPEMINAMIFGKVDDLAKAKEIQKEKDLLGGLARSAKGVGIANAIIETSTDGFIIFKTLKGAQKVMPTRLLVEFMTGYYKNVIKAGKNLSLRMLEAGLIEVPTEIWQEVNKEIGSYFTTDTSWGLTFNQIANVAITTLSTAPFMPFGASAVNTVNSFLTKYTQQGNLKTLDQDFDKIEKELINEVKNDIISESEYQRIVSINDIIREGANLDSGFADNLNAWFTDQEVRIKVLENINKQIDVKQSLEKNKTALENEGKLFDASKDLEIETEKIKQIKEKIKADQKVYAELVDEQQRLKILAALKEDIVNVSKRHNADPNSDRKYFTYEDNDKLIEKYLELVKENNLEPDQDFIDRVKGKTNFGSFTSDLKIDGKNVILVSLENINEHIMTGDFDFVAGNTIFHEDLHANFFSLEDSKLNEIVYNVQEIMLRPSLQNNSIQDFIIQRFVASKTLKKDIDYKIKNGKFTSFSRKGAEEYMAMLSDALVPMSMSDFSVQGKEEFNNLKEVFSEISKGKLNEKNILTFLKLINKNDKVDAEGEASMWVDENGVPKTFMLPEVDINSQLTRMAASNESSIVTEYLSMRDMLFPATGSKEDKNSYYIQETKKLMEELITEQVINNPAKLKDTLGKIQILNAGLLADVLQKSGYRQDLSYLLSRDEFELDMLKEFESFIPRWDGRVWKGYKPVLTEDEFNNLESPDFKVQLKEGKFKGYYINPVPFNAFVSPSLALRPAKHYDNAIKRYEAEQKAKDSAENVYSENDVSNVLQSQEDIRNNVSTSEIRTALELTEGSDLYDEIILKAAETIKNNAELLTNPAKFENAILKVFKKDWRYIRNNFFPKGKDDKNFQTKQYKDFVKEKITLIYKVMPVSEVTKLRLGLTEAVVLDETGRVRMRKKESEFVNDANIMNKTAGNTRRVKLPLTEDLKQKLIDSFLNPKDGRVDMGQERFYTYLANLIFRDASITGLKSKDFIDKHGSAKSIIGQIAQVLNKNVDFKFSDIDGQQRIAYADMLGFQEQGDNLVDLVEAQNFADGDVDNVRSFLNDQEADPAVKAIVLRMYDKGLIDNEDKRQYKQKVINLGDLELNKIITKTTSKGGQGSLRYNVASLNRLQKMSQLIVNNLPKEIVDKIGYSIFGYHLRLLDAAKQKTQTIDGKRVPIVVDGQFVSGPYYEDLETLKNTDSGISLPEGLNIDDVRLMNPTDFMKKLDNISLEQLQSLTEEINKANVANIKTARVIAKVVYDLYQQDKISKLDLYNFYQMQTSIKNGFRSLSTLDYISLNTKITQGEHVDGNGNTMFNAYRATVEGDINALNNAFDNHSQWATSKEKSDEMDTDPNTGKKTLKTVSGTIRFTVIKDKSNIVGIHGEPLSEVIIRKETEKLITKQAVLEDIKNKPVMSESSISEQFNIILEETEGIAREKLFSDVQGKIRGAAVDKYKILPIAPSGQDFKGLLYSFIGKGAQGESHLKFFEDNLITPYVDGVNKINEARLAIGKNYKDLIKKLPKVKTKLTDTVENTNFTFGQAVRVYLWNKNGFEIPGLSKRDEKTLLKAVNQNPDLINFANGLSKITQLEEGYVQPTEYWTAEGIASDLYSLTSKVGRAKFLNQFIENRKLIFGEFDGFGNLSGPNMAKIEATYGNKFKEALQDILYRMEFGRKRNQGDDRITNNWDNWINASVGSIMFFNMRSAVLQLISATNYVDTENNNVFASATAFANQPNYWRTVAKLWNSPFLQERLSGESRTINEAELASYVQGKENKVKAAISYLLKIGFTPTRVADAVAITFGGATYFINQKKAYIKEGLSEQEAEDKAMTDWIAKTQESQQSSDAMMISQQQAGSLGRIILAFKNTPMQYARLIDKAVRDIYAGRGSTKANLSKIAYYGFVQNLIFNMLQNAIWKANADDEEIDEKTTRTINGMFDSLVGGLGLGGNVVVTLKNGVLEYKKQDERGWNADHTYTILRLANLSPTIGSKLRKIYSSIQTEKFNKEAIKEMSYFNPGNPAFDVMANLISGLTNIPLDRAVNKVQNLIIAADSETEFWDSFALTLGWNTWDLGIEDEAKKVKRQIKEKKKAAKKRCTAIKSSGEQCKNKTTNKSGKCYAHDK